MGCCYEYSSGVITKSPKAILSGVMIQIQRKYTPHQAYMTQWHAICVPLPVLFMLTHSVIPRATYAVAVADAADFHGCIDNSRQVKSGITT